MIETLESRSGRASGFQAFPFRLGYGLAGIAADRLGASLVFVLGGAISASLIALGLLHPAIRAVDEIALMPLPPPNVQFLFLPVHLYIHMPLELPQPVQGIRMTQIAPFPQAASEAQDNPSQV